MNGEHLRNKDRVFLTHFFGEKQTSLFIFVNTAAAFLHYFKFDYLFTEYHKYTKTKCSDGSPVQHRRRCYTLKIAGAIQDGKPVPYNFSFFTSKFSESVWRI